MVASVKVQLIEEGIKKCHTNAWEFMNNDAPQVIEKVIPEGYAMRDVIMALPVMVVSMNNIKTLQEQYTLLAGQE